VFIDYGIGFGGSIISLAELVGGLLDDNLAESFVFLFQPEEFTRGRYPPGVARRLTRMLHYGRKAALQRGLARLRLQWLSPIVMRIYAAFDLVDERLLSRRIERHLRDLRPDILHLNSGIERSAILAARRVGIPTVVHVRGMMSVDGAKARRRFADLDAGIDHYVAISGAVADSIREVGVSAERVWIVHNAARPPAEDLDPSRVAEARAEWGIIPTDVVAAAFGRITDWKGQLDFVRAAERIAAVCPRLKLMIVGDESDMAGDYMDRLKTAVDLGPLRDRVVFTGYQHDVATFYGMSDIVVHCSNRPEPFGRVVIEGMAVGKPTIAMAEGGPLDIIEDGVDGLLVPPRDEAALASALRVLYDDPALRERLGGRARSTVVDRFSPRRCSHGVAEVYASVLRGDRQA
jgi:glycosyltransferase involved in cell wall biosynthesis